MRAAFAADPRCSAARAFNFEWLSGCQQRLMPVEISKKVGLSLSRPCRFCLCLQGGSVFADFDVDSEERVHLVRISFDGHGCCPTEGKATKMPVGESRTFVRLVNSADVNCDQLRDLLYRYFEQNQGVIWRHALENHELIKR